MQPGTQTSADLDVELGAAPVSSLGVVVDLVIGLHAEPRRDRTKGKKKTVSVCSSLSSVLDDECSSHPVRTHRF
jgi:hypothetical protein